MSRIEAETRTTEALVEKDFLKNFWEIVEVEGVMSKVIDEARREIQRIFLKKKLVVAAAYCRGMSLLEIEETYSVNTKTSVGWLATKGRILAWQHLSPENQKRFPLEKVLCRRPPPEEAFLTRTDGVRKKVMDTLKRGGNIEEIKSSLLAQGVSLSQLDKALRRMFVRGFNISPFVIKPQTGPQLAEEILRIAGNKNEQQLLDPLYNRDVQTKLNQVGPSLRHHLKEQDPTAIITLKEIISSLQPCQNKKIGEIAKELKKRGIPVGRITRNFNLKRGEKIRSYNLSYYFILSSYRPAVEKILQEILF